ncbi:MAG: hypothetical protein ACYCU7_16485 [Acidimicrobiales bacterium]
MGFLDRMKEQAATATAAARDAAQKGQAKLDTLQAKRAADALLRDLGAAHYAQHTGRATAETATEVTRLVDALGRHEAEHGPIDLKLESAATADGGSSPAGGSATPPPPPPPTSQSV